MPVASENSASQTFDAPIAARAAGEKFLVFLVGEEFYAVAARRVAEVGAAFAVTRLPNQPEWLLGVANLRGEIVPVVNSPAVLQQQNAAATVGAPKTKFIFLRSAFFEFGAALAATRVSEIACFAPADIEISQDENAPHVVGKIAHHDSALKLIDTEKLFSTLAV